MFCANCGATIGDDVRFCTSCGAPAAPPEASASQAQAQPTWTEPPVQPQGTADEPQPNKGNDRKRLTIVAIVLGALVVICCIVLAAILFNQQEHKQMTPRLVQVSFDAAGYSDECTRIPVAIVGTDSNGKAVDTVGFIDASGQGVELAPGEYDLSFPASPLTPDGILYNVPDTSDHVSIDKDSDEESTTNAFEESPAIFTKSSAIGETDQMIEDAYNYAIMDEDQKQRADELKGVATSVHAQAVEAESQRQAMEAARTIDMPYYTVKIPEYWVGKVDVAKDGNDIVIYAKGGSKESTRLVSVELVPQSYEFGGGDYMGGMIKSVNTSGGYRAEMWHYNWPGTPPLPYSSAKIPDSLMNTCIELETGGSLTLNQIQSDHSDSAGMLSTKYAQVAHEYLRNNVELIAK